MAYHYPMMAEHSFDDFASRQHSNMDAAFQEHEVTAPSVQLASSPQPLSIRMAATRKSRTRKWPARSDECGYYLSLASRRSELGEAVEEIPEGADSGRNMMACFGDLDDTPRIKTNIKIRNGRSKAHWPGFKSATEVNIPVGTSLKQICQFYPLHVWGEGLRMFMAEGWTAEEIYNSLPQAAKNSGAATRPWNYLQQAMGREADKMYEESGNAKRVPRKRKTAGRDDLVGVAAVSDGGPGGSTPVLGYQEAPEVAHIAHDPISPDFFSSSQVLAQMSQTYLSTGSPARRPSSVSPRTDQHFLNVQSSTANDNSQPTMSDPFFQHSAFTTPARSDPGFVNRGSRQPTNSMSEMHHQRVTQSQNQIRQAVRPQNRSRNQALQSTMHEPMYGFQGTSQYPDSQYSFRPPQLLVHQNQPMGTSASNMMFNSMEYQAVGVQQGNELEPESMPARTQDDQNWLDPDFRQRLYLPQHFQQPGAGPYSADLTLISQQPLQTIRRAQTTSNTRSWSERHDNMDSSVVGPNAPNHAEPSSSAEDTTQFSNVVNAPSPVQTNISPEEQNVEYDFVEFGSLWDSDDFNIPDHGETTILEDSSTLPSVEYMIQPYDMGLAHVALQSSHMVSVDDDSNLANVHTGITRPIGNTVRADIIDSSPHTSATATSPQASQPGRSSSLSSSHESTDASAQPDGSESAKRRGDSEEDDSPSHKRQRTE